MSSFHLSLEQCERHHRLTEYLKLEGTWKDQCENSIKHCLSYRPYPQLSKLHMLKKLLTGLNLSKYCKRWWGIHLWYTKINKIFKFEGLCVLFLVFVHTILKGRSDRQNANMKSNTRWRVILTFFAVMSDSIALYFIKP